MLFLACLVELCYCIDFAAAYGLTTENFLLKKAYEMKISTMVLAFFLGAVSVRANAFFFFVPGQVVGAIGDAITGAKGDMCVKEGANVGDVLKSTAGNTGVIKSLSGASGRCRNPATPIRAEIEFRKV